MRYSFTRKINLSRFFPEMEFENADFTVEDCDTKEQAIKEVETWIKAYVKSKKDPKKDFTEFLDKNPANFAPTDGATATGPTKEELINK